MSRIISYFTAPREPQVPLTFLRDSRRWKAGVLRNSIINAVGNLRTTEANSRKAYRAGRQNAAQAQNTTDFHRAQVQRLAALAHEHAQLCYAFEHSELISHNLGWQEDPTCRRALRGCLQQLAALNLKPNLIHPLTQHAPVIALVKTWYSPGFTCTESDFHNWIWLNYETNTETG